MGELRAVTTAGGHAMVGADDLNAFRARLRGPLLLSGDHGYDEARTVWNALIDRRPALIARCSGAADVIATVQFARDHDLLVSIKGGGHGVAGKAVCDGGLMIDLSRMKSIRVDPVARIVRAEPGVLGTDLDRETQAFGLATPVGTVEHRHCGLDARRRTKLAAASSFIPCPKLSTSCASTATSPPPSPTNCRLGRAS